MSIYPRTNYEMTEAQLAALLDAMRPVPAMLIGGSTGRSRQENANDAWARLGREMGFDAMTVQPVAGKGDRFFTAVPSETPEQRTAREATEAAQRKAEEVARLEAEIAERKERLRALTEDNPNAD